MAYQFHKDAGPVWMLALHAAVFVVTGMSVVCMALVDLWRRRDATSVLLGAWVFGTIFFSAFLNWSVTARTLLPAAPAVAILIVRRLEDKSRENVDSPDSASWRSSVAFGCPLVLSGLIAVAAAWSDFAGAAAQRDAARQIATFPRPSTATLWFTGHWGWQYYLQEAGGVALDFRHSVLYPGDVIAVATYTSNALVPDKVLLDRKQVLELPTLPWITVQHPLADTGFHSSVFGIVPLRVARVPPESFDVFVVRPAIDPSWQSE